MATILTFERRDSLVPHLDVGVFAIRHPSFTTPTSGIANGDYIRLFSPPRSVLLLDAWLSVSGTLGASANIRLVRNRSGTYANLTAATTAGGADLERMNILPTEVLSTDTIEILVGGANITAAAVVSVTILAQTL